MFLALGYDSIVCVGAIFLAGSMGTTFSTINPFSVVIASNAAGINFMEGFEWRVGGCIVGAIVVISYLYWYCKKIKANPEASYTYEDREHFAQLFNVERGETAAAHAEGFSLRKKAILVLFISAFVLMVYGVMNLHWWFPQMAAMFLAISIIIMFISGTDEKTVVNAFIDGASSLVGVSLIIGLARGINLIMEEGLISDTLLFWSSNAVQGMAGPAFILIMMLLFFLLGFVVPSSSGLAVLAMPIMAPLADTVGIDRYSIVCAYQWGQYAMLYLAPTGLVLATLTMLDMKYSKWFKFVWPIVVFTLVFGGILLCAQVMLSHNAANILLMKKAPAGSLLHVCTCCAIGGPSGASDGPMGSVSIFAVLRGCWSIWQGVVDVSIPIREDDRSWACFCIGRVFNRGSMPGRTAPWCPGRNALR